MVIVQSVLKMQKKEHDATRAFFQHMSENNKQEMVKFLAERNRGAAVSVKSRTICLMDATGSMAHLLEKSKRTVGIMFERASSILTQNGIASDSFELQFAVYRNYSSFDDILQHSPWESRPERLRAFMDRTTASGGLGNEAIEVGLWHANEELKRENITQVILIGDAPANTLGEVTQKSTFYGSEAYWNKKFGSAIYYKTELDKLRHAGVKVHAFYVDMKAKSNFSEIANFTGGKCDFLDINSNKGAQMLTDAVTEEILRDVGGEGKGDKLVEAYKKAYRS